MNDLERAKRQLRYIHRLGLENSGYIGTLIFPHKSYTTRFKVYLVPGKACKMNFRRPNANYAIFTASGLRILAKSVT